MVPERSTARANPARGLALIATAVIIGFFLLRNGWDQSVPDTSAAEASESGGGGTEGGGGGGETADTTAPAAQPRPADQVIVMVANTTSVSGAGGCMSDALETRTYQIRPPGNAEPARETTAILFQAGFDAEAAQLASDMGVQEAPAAIPNPPPVADLQDANLLVLLGTDLAQNACPPG